MPDNFLQKISSPEFTSELVKKRYMDSTVICDETDRIHLTITLRCNNNCSFCLQGYHSDQEHKSLDILKSEIDAANSKSINKVVISGGEPTLHPDFIKIIKYCKEVGIPNIQTISNGRIFSLKKFAKNAVKAGLTEVTLSLHGRDAETHDNLVKVPGAFMQIKKAVENLKSLGVVISIDVGIFEQNYKQLLDIVKLIYYDFGLICDIDIIGPTLQGSAVINKEDVMPNYKDVEPYLKEALEFCKQKNIVCWVLRVPLKYISGYEIFKEGSEKLVEKSMSISKDYNYVPLLCKGEKCQYCRFEDICLILENIELRLKQNHDSRNLPVNLVINSDNFQNSFLTGLNYSFDTIILDLDYSHELLKKMINFDIKSNKFIVMNPKNEFLNLGEIYPGADFFNSVEIRFDIFPSRLSLPLKNKRVLSELKVFEQIKKYSDFNVSSSINISNLNLKNLNVITTNIINAGAKKIIFNYMSLYNYIEKTISWDTGFEYHDKNKVFYDFKYLESYLEDAIIICKENNIDFEISEFPFCIFSDKFIKSYISNILPNKYITDISIDYFEDYKKRNLVKYMSFIYDSIYKDRIKDCLNCSHNDKCAGFDAVYLKYKNQN